MTKSRVAAFAAAAASIVLCGCGQSKPKLHLYTWVDYIDPEIVVEFEHQFDCKVIIETYDSNESMLDRLQAGNTHYDVAFPSSYVIEQMRDKGLLQELDASRLPNLANLDHAYDPVIVDPSLRYSVPYMISSTGIAYNASRCPEFEPTWRVFGDPRYARSCTLLNDMRETIGAALKTLGYSLNTTNEAEVAQATDLVIEWSKNIAMFDNELYKPGIVNGKFILVHGYSGDLGQVVEQHRDILYAFPREGSSIACDEMVILKNAKATDLAYAFINFLHDPKIAARNTKHTCFLCPNAASYKFLPPEVKADTSIFIPAEIRSKSETIRDLGDANALYVKAWDRVKAAQ